MFVMNIYGNKKSCRQAYFFLSQFPDVKNVEVISKTVFSDYSLLTIKGDCAVSLKMCYSKALKQTSKQFDIGINAYSLTPSGIAEMYQYSSGKCIKKVMQAYCSDNWNERDFFFLNAMIERYQLQAVKAA